MTTAEISLGWKALRDAAVSATRWGWPVMPGTFLGSNQRWYGREGATRLCPVEDSWAQAPVTDRVEAYEVWSENPYGVLLVCGHGVDALELPKEVRALLAGSQLPQVPEAVSSPPRRWLLFTATGSGVLSRELAQAGVRLHTAGSWVALPPTAMEFQCPQRWLAPPQPSTDGLPDAEKVQHALLTAIPRPPTRADEHPGCPGSAPRALEAGADPAPRGALTGPKVVRPRPVSRSVSELLIKASSTIVNDSPCHARRGRQHVLRPAAGGHARLAGCADSVWLWSASGLASWCA